MELDQSRFDRIAELIAREGISDRHRDQTRAMYRTVYGITPENAEPHLQMLFNLTIQERASPLQEQRYRELARAFSPEAFLGIDAHEDALDYLCEFDDIAQKIANEFLRQITHVLEVRADWIDELHVPIDTHIVKALAKTGAITGVDDPAQASVQDVVNRHLDANPRTRISYRSLQAAMEDAAETQDLPRIVFDELWLEHRHYLTDPFLTEESFLHSML